MLLLEVGNIKTEVIDMFTVLRLGNLKTETIGILLS